MKPGFFKFVTLYIFLQTGIQICSSANILFAIGISSYSHRIAMWPLIKSLAHRGHNVTIFSPYVQKEPDPQIHEFHPPEFSPWWIEFERLDAPFTFERRKHGQTLADWFSFSDIAVESCKKILGDPAVIGWMQATKFDLIVADILMNDCSYAFAHVHQAPVILYSTSTIYPWLYEQFGIPVESSCIPEITFYSPLDMNLWQRAVATLNPLMWQLVRRWYYFPRLETAIRELIPTMPSISEMEEGVRLLFLNSHYTEEYPRSLPPFVVEVGGAHCYDQVMAGNRSSTIPKEMEMFIEGAADGFAYVSFGSYVDITDNVKLQQVFLSSFSSLGNLRFILKARKGSDVQASPNVLVTDWCPQQELLAHPKIRLLITHGGLLSMHEAICHGVPMLSLPVFSEQDFNAERVQNKGIGIRLEITNVTSDELVHSILTVVSDSSYSNNIKLLSKLFRDRPTSPTATATWWTEYVLRHMNDNTSSEMKPLSRHQYWFQRRLLDVWAALAAVVAAVLYVVYVCLRKVVRYCGKGAPAKNSWNNGAKKSKTH